VARKSVLLVCFVLVEALCWSAQAGDTSPAQADLLGPWISADTHKPGLGPRCIVITSLQLGPPSTGQQSKYCIGVQGYSALAGSPDRHFPNTGVYCHTDGDWFKIVALDTQGNYNDAGTSLIIKTPAGWSSPLYKEYQKTALSTPNFAPVIETQMTRLPSVDAAIAKGCILPRDHPAIVLPPPPSP
jgi:hypothetical protein